MVWVNSSLTYDGNNFGTGISLLVKTSSSTDYIQIDPKDISGAQLKVSQLFYISESYAIANATIRLVVTAQTNPYLTCTYIGGWDITLDAAGNYLSGCEITATHVGCHTHQFLPSVCDVHLRTYESSSRTLSIVLPP